MSIQNRNLTIGNVTVLHETRFTLWAGRLYCWFKGHQQVRLKAEKFDRLYCVCCWKPMEEESNG